MKVKDILGVLFVTFLIVTGFQVVFFQPVKHGYLPFKRPSFTL